ncbi:hypothetical protein D2Q93_10420 [Alicyclobacillaceae bacterium I2511]|nr:hypothetical protein D2Q93_10420 [Alicyclobacillaceae bacterium I2511]
MWKDASAATQTIRQTPERGAILTHNRRFRMRYFVFVLVLAWAGYDYIHIQLPQLGLLQTQEGQLQVQLNTLNQQHVNLSMQSKQLQSDAYVAKYASEQYNLVLPGQVAFTVQSSR